MKRLVIMTVGKTHSGKTTFARALEQELNNSIVIDQDNHAEFINSYYKTLQPKQGPNKLKHAISQTIVDYAVNQTNNHLIICNSNRTRQGRLKLLDHFHKEGFSSILVHFDIPDHILHSRVARTQRRPTIMRSASSFQEVLKRQEADSYKSGVIAPKEDESGHLFVINNSDEVSHVIQKIVNLAGPDA